MLLKDPKDLTGMLMLTFFANESEVTDIGDNDILIYAGFTNLGNGARVGYPTRFYVWFSYC